MKRLLASDPDLSMFFFQQPLDHAGTANCGFSCTGRTSAGVEQEVVHGCGVACAYATEGSGSGPSGAPLIKLFLHLLYERAMLLGSCYSPKVERLLSRSDQAAGADVVWEFV